MPFTSVPKIQQTIKLVNDIKGNLTILIETDSKIY